MKNVLYFLVLLCFSAGCDKEKVTITENLISDAKVEQLVKNFEANGQSHLKAEQIISSDSAVWYLETTANFNYGDATKILLILTEFSLQLSHHLIQQLFTPTTITTIICIYMTVH